MPKEEGRLTAGMLEKGQEENDKRRLKFGLQVAVMPVSRFMTWLRYDTELNEEQLKGLGKQGSVTLSIGI